ncbi:MAG: phosphatidylglycerophosphatase A [Thermoanaerobaculales bacterium]
MLARMLATVGGLGDRWPAPGTTVGSVVGAALFWAASRLWPNHLLTVAMLGLAVLVGVSVWACGAEAARRGEPDPHPVVADEVAGQWLALAVVVAGRPQPPSLLSLAMAFVLFRVLDILKPWPIFLLERWPGGWGIVADDLAAGAGAGLASLALLVFL